MQEAGTTPSTIDRRWYAIFDSAAPSRQWKWNEEQGTKGEEENTSNYENTQRNSTSQTYDVLNRLEITTPDIEDGKEIRPTNEGDETSNENRDGNANNNDESKQTSQANTTEEETDRMLTGYGHKKLSQQRSTKNHNHKG